MLLLFVVSGCQAGSFNNNTNQKKESSTDNKTLAAAAFLPVNAAKNDIATVTPPVAGKDVKTANTTAAIKKNLSVSLPVLDKAISSPSPRIINNQAVAVSGRVKIAGFPVVAGILTGNYAAIGTSSVIKASSTFTWLRAASANGVYTAISGANGKTYTLTAADLNQYLKLEVASAKTASSSRIVELSLAVGPVLGVEHYLNHILSTGQSLALGHNGSPALTTVQPYNNKMLSGNSLVPLVENGVETISSAMANFITANTGGQIAVTIHGENSRDYSNLMKDSGPYNNGLSQAKAVKMAATASGTPDRVIAVTVIHGESNHIIGTSQALYEADLVQWQKDYNSDVKAITGQSQDVPLFTDQMSSQTGYNSATSAIPMAQLSAAEDHPGKIIMVGPKYFLDYSDMAHLTNTSYRWLGEYYGKVISRVVFAGKTWQPLSPVTVWRAGKVIDAKFHVPAGHLAIDTSAVAQRTNYGFEYADSSSSAAIESVQLLGTDTVEIILNSTPTGTHQRLRYAYRGVAGTKPGAQNVGAVGGNLRDTDDTVSQSGDHLYDWCVQFDKPVDISTTTTQVIGRAK